MQSNFSLYYLKITLMFVTIVLLAPLVTPAHADWLKPIYVPEKPLIPNWIQVSAQHWSGGLISDSDFIHTIDYLIVSGMIDVSINEFSDSHVMIPSWFKKTANIWASDHISDEDFLNSIKYLVNKRVILPSYVELIGTADYFLTVDSEEVQFTPESNELFKIQHTTKNTIDLFSRNVSLTDVLDGKKIRIIGLFNKTFEESNTNFSALPVFLVLHLEILPEENVPIEPDVRAIYGIADEQKNWKIMSTSLDGSDKNIIAIFDFNHLEGQRPIQALDIKLSPNGKYFLYSFVKDTPDSLWLVDTETKERKLIVTKKDNQRLSEYFWSPDSKKFTYSLSDTTSPCQYCVMPLYNILGPWYIYDIEKETKQMIRDKEGSLNLLGWWDNNFLVFVQFELRFEQFPIHLFNINWKTTKPLIETEYLPTVLINQEYGTRVFQSMMDLKTCQILIINERTSKESIISQNNTSCASDYNPNFSISFDGLTMMYGKSTSPSGGSIQTIDTDDNGINVISSIYYRDIQTGNEKPIFLGKPNGPYFIFGGWNEQHDSLAYIDWQKNNGTDIYTLKISKSDGSSPVEIEKSNERAPLHHKEIPFYGWKINS